MNFLYPQDLASVTLDRWREFQKRYGSVGPKRRKGKNKPADEQIEHPATPSLVQLKTILDVVYHVSFLTEESRGISVRIAYLPQGTEVTNLHESPVTFAEPLILSVPEILRLAPAIEPTTSILLVGPFESTKPEADGQLAIWGVLDIGSEFWEALTGVGSSALAPPNCLTVSTSSPGSLTVSTIGMVLARLRAGQLVVSSLQHFGEGHIGDFLKNAADTLYTEACRELELRKYANNDSNDYPYQRYFGTLERLVELVRAHRHGGTFIIIPDSIGVDDDRLRDRIAIKYLLDPPDVWQMLIRTCVANRQYYGRLFPDPKSLNVMLTTQADATAADLQALIQWERTLDRISRKLRDRQRFIATLAGVDGAVVLTDRFKVLGFGAEILANSRISSVKLARDPRGNHFVERPITSYGTRHRSALRLCSSFEQCVCIVVSQDGGVKVIRRVGKDLFMWDNVSLGSLGVW